MSYWLAPLEAARAIRDAEQEQRALTAHLQRFLARDTLATFIGPACAYCGTVGSPTAKRRCRECGAPVEADE